MSLKNILPKDAFRTMVEGEVFTSDMPSKIWADRDITIEITVTHHLKKRGVSSSDRDQQN